MRYIICDDCGGYYKLRESESLDDFDTCQCGGSLRYAQSFNESVKKRKEESTISCPHCGSGNKKYNITCINCGERLREIKRRVNYQPGTISKNHVSLLDRISFLGFFAGLIFLTIATIIAGLGMVGSMVSSNGVDILRSLGGYLIIMVFAIIGSGFIASYASGTKDYVDGLLNGGLVGLALSLLAAFFVTLMGMVIDVVMGLIAGIITLIVYVLIYGSLTAFGGLVAAWLRKNMEDY